jgi:hypothetical protein
MKFLTFLARIGLGGTLLILGANGFQNFLHLPAPGGKGGELLRLLESTHVLWVVHGLEVLSGLLILLRRVPLGLTLCGPVVVNIVLFHGLVHRTNWPPAAVVAGLSGFLLWRHAESFPALFPKPEPAKKPAKK